MTVAAPDEMVRVIPSPTLIDLAAERLGGTVQLASGEFSALKEGLLKPGHGTFLADKNPGHNQRIEGDSKRFRSYGWCIIRLGLPGTIKAVDIDTTHFSGSHVPTVSLDALATDASTSAEALAAGDAGWTEVLAQSELKPGASNVFQVSHQGPWTHVRMNVSRGGSVGHLRIHGTVIPDWSRYKRGDLVDLAAVEHGGTPVGASDVSFGLVENLIMPGRAEDGWETKRHHGPGYDWAILKLGRPGVIRRIEVDTGSFRGNQPDECSIDVLYAPVDPGIAALTSPLIRWDSILPRTKLHPDTRHILERELLYAGECSHIRLNIYPDGGISRLRVWGEV